MSGQNMYQLQKPVSMRYKNVELRIIRRLCYTEWKKFYNAMCNTKTPNKYRTTRRRRRQGFRLDISAICSI